MKFKFIIATQKPDGTRLPIHDFLDNVKHDNIDVELDIHYDNHVGLSKTYNISLSNSMDLDFAAFVHDDVWINDHQFFSKVINSKYDVIGNVGGLRYVVPSDWETRPFLWTGACGGKASGFVLHKHPTDKNTFIPSSFGPSPLPCVWLDGQMIIFNRKALESALVWDEEFDFDFYDGSLCFRARQKGLKVGTAPILATHESCGQGMMAHKDLYMESQRKFIKKWFCR